MTPEETQQWMGRITAQQVLTETRRNQMLSAVRAHEHARNAQYDTMAAARAAGLPESLVLQALAEAWRNMGAEAEPGVVIPLPALELTPAATACAKLAAHLHTTVEDDGGGPYVALPDGEAMAFLVAEIDDTLVWQYQKGGEVVERSTLTVKATPDEVAWWLLSVVDTPWKVQT